MELHRPLQDGVQHEPQSLAMDVVDHSHQDHQQQQQHQHQLTSLETVSSGLLHSVTKIKIITKDGNATDGLPTFLEEDVSSGEMSRGHKILLWTGVIFLATTVIYIMYRLCIVSTRRIFGGRRRRRPDRQGKALNKILANSGAREVLRSRALTALNSQANRRISGVSSRCSMETAASVPDISERVIRVSFAPVERGAIDPVIARQSGETTSLGGESAPPDYETLSAPPPNYSALSSPESSPRTQQPQLSNS